MLFTEFMYANKSWIQPVKNKEVCIDVTKVMNWLFNNTLKISSDSVNKA